jgi:hypothetical protein
VVLAGEVVKWATPFSALEKAPNFGNLFSNRASEPPGSDQVMEHPQDPPTEVKLLDVSETNTVSYIFNLKPGVKAPWNPVLQGHVDVTRAVPLVSSDHRSLNRPKNLPSSRANMPLGVSASLVTHTIFVSALVY